MAVNLKNGYKLLSDITYDAIKEAIVNGDLEAGVKISETSLAKQLGVSRTPVREALRLLYAEGFVSLTPNSSFVINEFKLEDAIEVLEIRRLLEGEAAKLAAERLDEKGEALLDELTAEINKYIELIGKDDPHMESEADIRFHKEVYKLSRNSRLIAMSESIQDKQVRMYISEGFTPENDMKFHRQHITIIDAIRTRNPELAEKAAHEHIDFIKELVLEIYSNKTEE